MKVKWKAIFAIKANRPQEQIALKSIMFGLVVFFASDIYMGNFRHNFA